MEQSESKNHFIGFLAHELRSPMAVTKGYISMILEGTAGPISGKVEEFLKEVYESNERLIKLVNDMERVVQVDNGAVKFSPEAVPLATVISEVAAGFKEKIEKKGLTLRFVLPDDPNLAIVADRACFTEVVSRLLENAAKFTDKGEISLATRLEAIDGRDMVTLTVSDTGLGISKEDAVRVFEKFGKGGPKFTAHRGGTGLGLYIVKKLTDDMGGRVSFRSEAGQGSSFFVSFPRFTKSGDGLK